MISARQGQWTTSLGAFPSWLGAHMARPDVQGRLRVGVVTLLILWTASSLVTAIWSFVPPAAPLPTGLQPINPALAPAGPTARSPADLNALLAARLFGEADIAAATMAAEQTRLMSEEEASTELAGIEDGARDSGLPLTLRGIVAASEAGLGQAIIEYRNQQDLYRVGDDLPVGNRVSLAKVMRGQVVIDNGGRYELLRLFAEDGALSAQVPGRASGRPRQDSTDAGESLVRAGPRASELATVYRERLYTDPQSLVELVTVAAVRQDGQLLGYRVRPGSREQEFSELGFIPGDLVTAINGMPLSDPANVMRLHQLMRSAQQADFDIRRGTEELTLSVSLGSGQ